LSPYAFGLFPIATAAYQLARPLYPITVEASQNAYVYIPIAVE